jgi:oxalate decarboxylase/phosphoglucose isomerase-like protein (cupin superfamily)
MTTTGNLTTASDDHHVSGELSLLPDELQVGSDRIRFHVTAAQTAGALVAAEVRMPPGGGPPVLHRHGPAEIYRVERGELAFYVEDDDAEVRRLTASPGSVVPIAGGRAHTIRNETGDEALAYVVYAPGAPMEAFVRAAATLPAPPSMDAVLDLAQRHGIEMAGPVPEG